MLINRPSERHGNLQKDSLLGIYGSDVIALKVIESLHLTSNQMSLARIASRDIRPAKPMGLVPSSILEGPIIKSGQRCCSFSYDEKFAIKCAEYIVDVRSRLNLFEVRTLSQLGIKDEKRRSMRSARRRQWRNTFVTIDGQKRSLWRVVRAAENLF